MAEKRNSAPDRKTGKRKGTPYGDDQFRAGRPISPAVAAETDPEWRNWFLEIERRRVDLGEKGGRAWVCSLVEKDGAVEKIIRKKSAPTRVASFLQKTQLKKPTGLAADYREIENLWTRTVGEEIVAESRLFSFKRGVLTMEISSSTLLQEIRQFHQEAILHDMRSIWTLKTPLLSIRYRQGTGGKK